MNGGSPTAGCSDTPLLCVAEKADNFDARRSLFCSVDIADKGTYCSDQTPRTLKYGWCCFPSQKCGTKLGECGCSGQVCGQGCCPGPVKGAKTPEGDADPGWYCEGGNICKRKCAGGATGVRCGTDCCTGQTHCAGDHCECTAPAVVCATGCCNPKTTTEDPLIRNPLWDFWKSLIGDTAATHGGGTHGLRELSLAHGAAAATAGAVAAVAQVAVVNAQTGAALAAFTDGHHDSAFKQTVKAAKPSLPKLQAGVGLDAASANALSALLTSQAHASALLAAAATALARQRGATARHDRAHARRQLLASANFTSQAVKILKGIPKLRANAATALSAAKTPEIYATSAAVQALQADVRKHGVPTDLRAQLARLGVKGSADLARIKKGLLDDVHTVDSMAGGVLIAPLTDSASSSALQTITTNLATYATKARSHPIARGHG